jgi:hypothetical protein
VVKWATSSELNTQKFVVERSVNGTDFITIGNVLANGNSNVVLDYEFIDNNIPVAKKVYYRIRIIDKNGTEKISKIVYVFTNKAMLEAEIVQIVPNPMVSESTVKVLCKTKGNYNYQVINNLGQVVTSNKITLVEGNNDIKIQRSNLRRGIYVFKLSTINNQGQINKTIVVD